MSKRRVVVTGIGAVTPFGVGVDNLWKNIAAGKSGIDTITMIDLEKHSVHIAGEVKNFDPLVTPYSWARPGSSSARMTV